MYNRITTGQTTNLLLNLATSFQILSKDNYRRLREFSKGFSKRTKHTWSNQLKNKPFKSSSLVSFAAGLHTQFTEKCSQILLLLLTVFAKLSLLSISLLLLGNSKTSKAPLTGFLTRHHPSQSEQGRVVGHKAGGKQECCIFPV